jgi:uncharacterized protein YdhG (YjbR/CyaY superfamily)
MATSTKSTQAATIDDYIKAFPVDVQKSLKEIRATIKKVEPKAEECIKYAIPTFTYNGTMVSFAGWKTHIAFYPAPVGVKEFEKEIVAYKGSKSTLKFPMEQPIPLNLIGKIVAHRFQQNHAKSYTKTKKK